MTAHEHFVSSIPDTAFFRPDGHPEASWQLFSGATLDEAREHARAAILQLKPDGRWIPISQKVHQAVEKVTKGKNFCEWDEVQTKAAETVMKALEGTSMLTRRNAARDAGTMVSMLFVADLDFKDKASLTAMAKSGWEVWQKGYCLLADVQGVLYVYHQTAA